MNNYEFGRMVYKHCHVAEVRGEIMAAVKTGGGACDAVNGFVSVMSERVCKSAVERKFLKEFDKAMRKQEAK